MIDEKMKKQRPQEGAESQVLAPGSGCGTEAVPPRLRESIATPAARSGGTWSRAAPVPRGNGGSRMAQENASPWRTTEAKGQLESCHKDITSNNVAMMVQVVMVEAILTQGRMANALKKSM